MHCSYVNLCEKFFKRVVKNFLKMKVVAPIIQDLHDGCKDDKENSTLRLSQT